MIWMPASRRCTVLSVTLLASTLSLPACRGSAGSQKAAAGSTAPSPQTPEAPAPGEIKWSVISLAGKSPSETAVLPLHYYHTYLPVIPVPPPTARDYDARMAFRETALKMVEQKNIVFFNALKDAVGQLDISREWQENYERWVKIGHEAGVSWRSSRRPTRMGRSARPAPAAPAHRSRRDVPTRTRGGPSGLPTGPSSASIDRPLETLRRSSSTR